MIRKGETKMFLEYRIVQKDSGFSICETRSESNGDTSERFSVVKDKLYKAQSNCIHLCNDLKRNGWDISGVNVDGSWNASGKFTELPTNFLFDLIK